jgi:hypothetical protein
MVRNWMAKEDLEHFILIERALLRFFEIIRNIYLITTY